MRKFLFISDPGHGWLRVKHKDVLPVKGLITNYSYIDLKYVYLEEDCDAVVFLEYLKENGIKYQISHKYGNRSSSIRKKGCYNPDVLCKKFGEGDLITLKAIKNSVYRIINESDTDYIVQNIKNLSNRYRVKKKDFFTYVESKVQCVYDQFGLNLSTHIEV